MRKTSFRLSLRERKILFYAMIVCIGLIVFLIVCLINNILENLLPVFIVIISPIVEESLKMIGYWSIFIIDFNKIFRLRYLREMPYIQNNLQFSFLIIVGGFYFIKCFNPHHLFYLPHFTM